ncbi:hypothetical protein V7152_23500 [Neobacillus drentensis]|uniref:hypothetical protein n=1 Tax=Neobacillus drentensis TaxID=220684 RepID=UPI002FFF8994
MREGRRFEGLRKMADSKGELQEWLKRLELKEREIDKNLAEIKENLNRKKG